MVRRRRAVGDLFVQGHSQIAIADQLGISQPTVSTDLKAIQKQWREAAVRDFDEQRERELRKLDALELESWKAWQRSQKPSQEAILTTDGTSQRTQKKVAEQVGDVRFLEQISKCIAARRALLGLDAPTKVAPTSPDGSEAYHCHVMSELMRLAEQSSVGPVVIDAEAIERESQLPRLEQSKPTAEGLVTDEMPNPVPTSGVT